MYLLTADVMASWAHSRNGPTALRPQVSYRLTLRMPFTERLVDQRFAYLDKRFVPQDGKTATLQDFQIASLYGTIAQLGHLSAYAAQVFDSLYEASKSQGSRLAAVTKLAQEVKAVADADGRSCVGPSAPKGGVLMGPPTTTRAQGIMHGLFQKDTRPRAVVDRYTSHAVSHMPDFTAVDHLLGVTTSAAGEDAAIERPQLFCGLRYSNPEFFANEWVRAEKERIRRLEEERKARRAERRARKQQLLEARASQKRSAVNVKSLDWRKKYENSDVVLVPKQLHIVPSSHKDLVQRQQRGSQTASSLLVEEKDMPESIMHQQSPPPPPQQPQQQASKAAPPAEQAMPSPPSPLPIAPAVGEVDRRGAPISSGLLSEIRTGAKLRPPSPVAAGGGVTISKQIEHMADAAPASASNPRSNLKAGLLTAIAQGSQLRSAADAPKAPLDPKRSMLQEIKLNSAKLKHVESPQAAAAVPGEAHKSVKKDTAPKLAQEVQDILARRKFLQQADSSDDSGDEGWDE